MDSSRETISIIIPVYNAQEYLPACLDSVINQTYTNLEIILVDDGSTDSSGEICEYYSEKDKRIKTIHKANAGVSAARNDALRVLTGEWVTFVDSDDVIPSDAVSTLIAVAHDSHADIVSGRVIKFFW